MTNSTLLIKAIRENKPIVVEFLLKEGSDKEVKDGYGRTPLHWAAKEGHTEIVKLLLDAGADKEVKDKLSATPLQCRHRLAALTL